MNYDLSIIIPARNEMFLKETIEDLLRNIRGNTEIIAVLDGYWPVPSINDHPRVTLLHFSESIGQRAATNAGVKLSKAKYVAKVDGHCSFDEGFDVKLLADMQDDWTLVPIMRNLWAFDWVCKKCGNRTYQGPTPKECKKDGCDNKTDFYRQIVWIGKSNPSSDSYCFDSEPHFQYFRDYRKTEQYKKDKEKQLTETMSLQGSFFMCTREKYWELDLCDESFGSWGNQGIEVATKTWLSGGKCMVSHKTWYAHMFRTSGGDFGFPYPLTGKEVKTTKDAVKEIIFKNKWSKAKYPIHWLVEKFWPVSGWTQEQLEKLK